MNNCAIISNYSGKLSGTIELPGSKSESNRALIINELSGKKSLLNNLSSSIDTKIFQKALASKESVIDIGDAGTAMRFLTSYFAATKQDKILTGSVRMLERPIGLLVDALNFIGADIEYLGKAGFPPIKINGSKSFFNKNIIKLSANISSQFISALLLIAPVLPDGLDIEIEGTIFSKPYIDMTLAVMRCFGIKSNFVGNKISIRKQSYIPSEYTIESDWSCASYWYAMTALANDPFIFLKGLKRLSLQGDSITQEWFKPFGVITEFSDNGVFITKGEEDLSSLPEIIDFSDHPDLAQTMIVLCAAKNIKCKFTGLNSLRIKETDRIQALQNELKKLNILFIEDAPDIFSIHGIFDINATPLIETYNDHRMAMAFAPLAVKCSEIGINKPFCVKKSYPAFWEDMKIAGFKISG